MLHLDTVANMLALRQWYVSIEKIAFILVVLFKRCSTKASVHLFMALEDKSGRSIDSAPMVEPIREEEMEPGTSIIVLALASVIASSKRQKV